MEVDEKTKEDQFNRALEELKSFRGPKRILSQDR